MCAKIWKMAGGQTHMGLVILYLYGRNDIIQKCQNSVDIIPIICYIITKFTNRR